MQYIIDGYNFINRAGILDDCEFDLEKARDLLFVEIENSFKRKNLKDKAVIVFDSKTTFKKTERYRSNCVKVIFTTTKDTADSKIIKMLKNLKEEERKKITVVSSDMAVYENCMFLLAKVMTVENYMTKL